MHIAIVIIAIFLVGSGILVRSKTTRQAQQEVLGEIIPTTSPAPSETHTPTITPSSTQNSSTTLTDFIYPNANINAQSETSLTLSASDDAQVITDWYKNKIKELGMNTRSFVQTKTNDNVNNVLSAAKGSDEIKVTITKKAGDQQVSIVVSR